MQQQVQPRIFYGDEPGIPLDTVGQYLCMQAGIESGDHEGVEFSEKIANVHLDDITHAEIKNTVKARQALMSTHAKHLPKVVLDGFNPDKQQIEDLIYNKPSN